MENGRNKVIAQKVTETVRVYDRNFRLLIDEAAILKRVGELAKRIDKDFAGRKPLILAVLNGAFVFAADLIRSLELDIQIQFIKLSSYSSIESTGDIDELIGIDDSLVEGKDVIVVEDIVDTGLTLGHLRQLLRSQDAASISIATLLLKPSVFQGKYPVEYIGFEIPERFVVGYGLDYDGYGRSLPGIYQLDES